MNIYEFKWSNQTAHSMIDFLWYYHLIYRESLSSWLYSSKSGNLRKSNYIYVEDLRDSIMIHDANLIQVHLIKCIVDLHSRLEHLLDKQMISCPGKCFCQKQPMQSTLFWFSLFVYDRLLWQESVLNIFTAFLVVILINSILWAKIYFY